MCEDTGLEVSCNLPRITLSFVWEEQGSECNLPVPVVLPVPIEAQTSPLKPGRYPSLSLLHGKHPRAPIRYCFESRTHMIWPSQSNMGDCRSSSRHVLEGSLSHLRLSIRTLLWQKKNIVAAEVPQICQALWYASLVLYCFQLPEPFSPSPD